MTSTPSEPLLRLDGLNAGYEHGQILYDIDLRVHPGEIVLVLGANGAGKTTLITAVSGACRIISGRVVFDGEDITGLRPDRIVGRGLAQCPEGRQIFQRLSVEENLVAAYLGRGAKSFEHIRADVFDLFPILEERRNTTASRLSGGQQQMLAIGRALMAQPVLLMLDEPSLGLAPRLIHQIFSIVLDLSKAGISVLLVEQNVRRALEIGDYAYILESGRCRLEGGAERLAAEPALAELYLAAPKADEVADARRD